MVTAVMSIFLMMAVGLATLSFSDSQTHQSGIEQAKESAFNVAEGALNAQVYLLSRYWPGSAAQAYPASCPSAGSAMCETINSLVNQFSGADIARGATWTTQVRDDSWSDGNLYLSSSFLANPTCSAALTPACWDQGGPGTTTTPDGRMWVRAQATVNKQTRTLVALVQVEQHHVNFPSSAVTAGSMATGNNGKKIIIETKDPNTGQVGAVQVRCSQAPPSSCLNYNPSKGQVDPPGSYTLNYPATTAITAGDLSLLQENAQSTSSYYTSCPSGSPPSGAKVVYIQTTSQCSISWSFPQSSPGILIIDGGSLQMSGNTDFYGIIYITNPTNSNAVLFNQKGNVTIHGGVAIDGAGELLAGESKLNIQYDSNIVNNVTGFGTAGIVQNTWREVNPGQ